ncbi:MAG: DUF86 domain-containing protein [Candidatus Saliniplasma sp.]
MKKDRYLKKIETFEKEKEFIENHEIKDDTSERAVLYSLQICIEVAMDLAAMRIKDTGLVVEDDYTNIEKLIDEDILSEEKGSLLKQFNGIRNAIVHKYDKLNIDIIKEAINKIGDLSETVNKISK